MDKKFTQGKWSVDKSDYRTTKGGLCVMNDNQCIAVIGDGNPHHPIEANALLISKAPEMLDMLKECMRVLSSVQSPATPSILLHREIKQLIKEATEL